jgi:hypothetical protein
VGPWHGDEALAADGVIIAITAAVNISTIPIPTDFVTRLAGFRASARMFCFFMISFFVLALFDSWSLRTHFWPFMDVLQEIARELTRKV